MPAPSPSSLQRDHYNAIHDEYDAHYGDEGSLEYRRRFFLDPRLDAIPGKLPFPFFVARWRRRSM